MPTSGRNRGPAALIPILVLLGAVVFGLPATVNLYAEWLWFGEVGYQQVFLRPLTAKATLWTVTFLVAFVVLAANLRVAFKALRHRTFQVLAPDGPRTIELDPHRFRPILFGAAAVVSLLMASVASSQWAEWLFFSNATPFGKVDPILGRDVSFYVFRLPFLHFAQGLLTALFGVTLVAVGAIHVVSGNLGFDPHKGLFARGGSLRHISLLGAAFLLTLALGAWLAIPTLLTTPSVKIQGASYADLHARMPALRLLVVAALIGAVLAVYQSVSRRFWPAFAAVGLYLAVWLGGPAYAAVIQRFVVAPNEQVRETPFIVNNIAATRDAFNLHVEERELAGDATLTRDDIQRNHATLENVPLWNHQPLLDTFGQLQEIRTYYDFVSVDNDRYVIDGKYRQIMLSARELNSTSLPSRSWINERLTFTHGYGLTLGPVNQVTPEGLPVLFIRDLPPVSTTDLAITQPALYFGELSNDHVFVRTQTKEFDYPRGDDNVFTTYAGDGGIPIDSFFKRLIFAIRFRSTDTLFSPNLAKDSRLLMHRRIADRVNRIAPFLTYDPDPYPAISEGRLIWIQDAYTTSRHYPYSTPARSGVNFIRNSIKATIDAYHGTVVFHLIDPSDPIAQTVGKIFPNLLQPLAAMPEDLRTRLRYPQGIFSLQAAMYSTYHMSSPAIFYNREDQWDVPAADGGERASRMEPYYTIMKLPGEAEPEFIQMLPFTPREKDNLAAWMVARSDGEHYGKLMVFQFPKQTVVYGPRQVAARINQDQVISPQITLWNQQGSEVIQGTLLVIPIEESLIYVRPLYLRAAGGRIPELKRVIVAHQNQIVMEPTLEAALERIFPSGGAVAAGVPTADPSVTTRPPAGSRVETGATAALAREHFRRAIQAQRDGDWKRYGEELEKVREILDRM